MPFLIVLVTLSLNPGMKKNKSTMTIGDGTTSEMRRMCHTLNPINPVFNTFIISGGNNAFMSIL
jgi:hypothetical protein